MNATQSTALAPQPTGEIMPQQAHSDAQVLALWLHGHSEHTQRAYLSDVQRLLAFVDGKPLAAVTLGELQAFADSLSSLSANTQKRTLSSIKSLLTFAQKIGYVRFNVGAALKAPKPKHTLAERILTEEQVHALLAAAESQRDKVLLRLLYASACRVSELCALTWRDVQPSGDSGQVTLFGKGDKTRSVKLSRATWQALQALRGSAKHTDPVFMSQKGGHLDPSQVHRIVRAAAQRAGIVGNVSPHWLRHSHASHALERGASAALVRDTLGHDSLATTDKYSHARPGTSSALHLSV